MASLRADARTTPGAVRDIFETDLDDPELHAFINAASYKVDAIEDAEPGTSTGLLREVEKWYAAHLVTARPELAESEDMESYSVEYVRETEYGEMAASLDPSDVLAPDSAYIDFSTPDAKGTRE